MKIIIITALLISSAMSSATEINIYSVWNAWAQIENNSFDINPSLNRAWVVVTLDQAPNDPDIDTEEIRVKVEGLSYDSETKEVIFVNENDVPTVCAYLKISGRGIFRRKTLKKTNNCSFKTSFKTKYVDDGYHVTKRKYRIVTLVIND